MTAIVKGVKRNGEQFNYTLEVSNVIYKDGAIVLIKEDGKPVAYAEAISKGYKYNISIA